MQKHGWRRCKNVSTFAAIIIGIYIKKKNNTLIYKRSNNKITEMTNIVFVDGFGYFAGETHIASSRTWNSIEISVEYRTSSVSHEKLAGEDIRKNGFPTIFLFRMLPTDNLSVANDK